MGKAAHRLLVRCIFLSEEVQAMVINTRIAILFLCFIGMPLLSKNNDETSHKNRLFKNIANISAGVGLGLLAHIFSEYFVVTAHELGHCTASALTGGKFGEFNVTNNFKELGPLAIAFPFRGYSRFSGDIGNEAITVAAGPAAGMLTSYALMAGVEAKYNGQKKLTKESAKKALLKPIAVYPSIARGFEKLMKPNKESISISGTFNTTFAFLKMSRIIGEAIYGLTPLCAIPGGDGERLWQILGNVKPKRIIGFLGLTLLAATPGFIAAGYGIAQGLMNK